MSSTYGNLIPPTDDDGPFGGPVFVAPPGREPHATLRFDGDVVTEGRLSFAGVTNNVPTIVIDGTVHEYHGGTARRVGLTVHHA